MADLEIVAPEPTTGEQAVLKDMYYWSFVEGATVQKDENEQKIGGMVGRMKASAAFSFATLFLGPMYWAYRKCYFGAAVLIALYILVFCIAIPFNTRLFRWIPGIIAGCFFFRVYRYKADMLIEQARAEGLETPERICTYLRERGGTNLPAAIIAGVAYLGIAVAIIAYVLPNVLAIDARIW